MKSSSANIPAVSLVITAQICRRAATKEINPWQPFEAFPAAESHARHG
jgi:hypothetical protein